VQLAKMDNSTEAPFKSRLVPLETFQIELLFCIRVFKMFVKKIFALKVHTISSGGTKSVIFSKSKMSNYKIQIVDVTKCPFITSHNLCSK
jgi:hypothetical protein